MHLGVLLLRFEMFFSWWKGWGDIGKIGKDIRNKLLLKRLLSQ